MQDAIAIASVAATATVAIAVPIINARGERFRLRGQLQHERLDELRSVLDSGWLALGHARDRLRSAELAVEKCQAAEAGNEDEVNAERAISLADEALREVSDQAIRAALRLGPEAELTIAYGRASEALNDEIEVLRGAFLGGPVSDDPRGWKEVVGPLNEARRHFDAAHLSASRLAAELIGPFSKS